MQSTIQSLADTLPYLHAFGMSVLRTGAWLVLLSVIFVPLERLFALRREKILRAGLGADLGYFFLNSVITSVLIAIPLSAVAVFMHRMLPGAYLAAVAALPFWLRLVLALVVGEIGSYWGHRWCHNIPFLWRFHAIHHSPVHVDFLVHTRVHPVDWAFTRVCGLVPLYALGLVSGADRGSGILMFLVVVLGTAWGFFIHSNTRIRLGPLEHLVSSPAYHHWHHTMSDHRNHNFAPLLPWVDRMFGTLHLPRHAWPAAYGADAPVPASFTAQLAYPLTLAIRPEDVGPEEIRGLETPPTPRPAAETHPSDAPPALTGRSGTG